ncbi:MAG: GtrA family protein [Clostridia bacterium]|nr:GtrA family protein [Clostridia bacterium]
MKQFYQKHKEVILYFTYGALTSLVNVVLYALLVPIIGMTASNAVAWFGAVVFAFVTNKLFVFGSKEWKTKETLKEAGAFLGARIFSGILEIVLPTVLFHLGLDHDLFGIKGFLAKICVCIIVILLNYVLSKTVVFRKKR